MKTNEVNLKMTKDYNEDIAKLVKINISLTNKLNETIYLENLTTKTSSCYNKF